MKSLMLSFVARPQYESKYLSDAEALDQLNLLRFAFCSTQTRAVQCIADVRTLLM